MNKYIRRIIEVVMFMIIFIITMLTVDYFEINETWFLICLVMWYRFDDNLKEIMSKR